jgi:hypothetical protein
VRKKPCHLTRASSSILVLINLMPAHRLSRLLLMLATAMLLLATRSPAQLAANSPFLPAASSGSATVTEGAAIELRGVMETRAGLSFCIFDPAKKVSTWTGINQKGYDFLVKSYDAGHETVSVDYGGRSITLAMRVVKVASSGQASAPMPLLGLPFARSAITQSVVLNPTPADEQARLEAVATEVRRRRALREQASIQAANGVQPLAEAPGVPPAQQPRTQPQGQNPPRTRQRN